MFHCTSAHPQLVYVAKPHCIRGVVFVLAQLERIQFNFLPAARLDPFLVLDFPSTFVPATLQLAHNVHAYVSGFGARNENVTPYSLQDLPVYNNKYQLYTYQMKLYP